MKKEKTDNKGYKVIDEMGRVVIPKEIRQQLDIRTKDPLDIFVDTDSIILRKHNENCVFCRSEKELTDFDGKMICKSCIDKISKLQ